MRGWSKGNVPEEVRLKIRRTLLGKDLPEREIVELFRSGNYSMQDLATRFKCARHCTIRRILSAYFTDDELFLIGKRVGQRKTPGNTHPRYKPIPEGDVVSAYLGGKSRTDLAKQHGVSQDKIQRVLHRHLTAEEMKANRYRLSSSAQRGRITTPLGLWKQSWTQVSSAVHERDGGKCRRCSSTLRITTHHLLPKILDPARLLWLVQENLVTLCRSCHGKIEPKGWETIPSALGFKEYYDACGLYLSEQRVISLLSKIAEQNSIAI